MTNDGCVIAQSSNMFLSPVRQTVIYALQLFAESKSKHQASRHLPGVQASFEVGRQWQYQQCHTMM
jgi:hypothetical protein